MSIFMFLKNLGQFERVISNSSQIFYILKMFLKWAPALHKACKFTNDVQCSVDIASVQPENVLTKLYNEVKKY